VGRGQDVLGPANYTLNRNGREVKRKFLIAGIRDLNIAGRSLRYKVDSKDSVMKLAGFLLLPSGWGLTLAALGWLKPGTPQEAFVLAGIGVELLGIVLVFRAHMPVKGDRE
jgi:hypothetical protein